MSLSKKLMVSAIMLGSMQSMAKISKFKPFKPNFDVNFGSVLDRQLDLKKTDTIQERNSFFLERANQYVANKARKRAIRFLDENWKERDKRFKTDTEYMAFKSAFLKGEFSPTKVIDNKKSKRTLKSMEASLEDIGFSLLSEENFSKRLAAYRSIYEMLPISMQDNLTSPDRIRDIGGVEYNFTIIYEYLGELEGAHLIDVNPYPRDYEQNCEDEIGYQAPISINFNTVADKSERCDISEYHRNGLYINKDYPLKYNTTCIKDQANRGTCVSFSINAAIETQGYVNEGKAYNLSEQFTYFYAEVYGGSTSGKAGRYDYGLNNDKTMSVLDLENINLQLERRWPYNPSWNMAASINSNNKWANSCDDYLGPVCTNRAFQARETEESCGWFCTQFNYTVPQYSTSRSDTFQVTGRTSFWSSLNQEGSLDQAITYVNAGKPVIAGVDVRTYMWEKASSSGDGYIKYQTENDAIEGGHAFLIIGFVSNSDLPEGAPRATERGYFIIKNSWGIGAGDCGYVYIDYKLMKKDVTSLHIITSRRP